MTGSGVFPAASARGVAGAPASAVVAAASAAATATAAAAAAVIPPDWAGKMAAARGGVFPTPPVDWTTTRHNQPPETATTQRRWYQVTPTVTRSGSRRIRMSGAFALLEADEQMVRSLASGFSLRLGDATNVRAGTHGTTLAYLEAAERKDFAGLTATGTFKPAGEK